MPQLLAQHFSDVTRQTDLANYSAMGFSVRA
jgi:hypothetical protein